MRMLRTVPELSGRWYGRAKCASPQYSLPALYLLAVDIEIAGSGDIGRPLTAGHSSRPCSSIRPLMGSSVRARLLVHPAYFIDLDLVAFVYMYMIVNRD